MRNKAHMTVLALAVSILGCRAPDATKRGPPKEIKAPEYFDEDEADATPDGEAAPAIVERTHEKQDEDGSKSTYSTYELMPLQYDNGLTVGLSRLEYISRGEVIDMFSGWSDAKYEQFRELNPGTYAAAQDMHGRKPAGMVFGDRDGGIVCAGECALRLGDSKWAMPVAIPPHPMKMPDGSTKTYFWYKSGWVAFFRTDKAENQNGRVVNIHKAIVDSHHQVCMWGAYGNGDPFDIAMGMDRPHDKPAPGGGYLKYYNLLKVSRPTDQVELQIVPHPEGAKFRVDTPESFDREMMVDPPYIRHRTLGRPEARSQPAPRQQPSADSGRWWDRPDSDQQARSGQR